MVRVPSRGLGASAEVPVEKDSVTSSVERSRRVPDDGTLAQAAAVEPPPSAPATTSSAPEEDYTVVLSKKERRRQRKETATTQDVTKTAHTQSVELPRCAPDGGARPRAPPQDYLAPTTPSAKNEDHDQRNDSASQSEDQDMDEDPVGTFAEWRLTAVGESFTTRYQAVSWLESVCRLSFSVRVTSSGDYYVRPKSLKTASVLSEIAMEKPEGIVIEKSEVEIRGVVLGFPVHLPLDAIVEHPRVRSAERCFFNAGRGRRLPTRSVRVTFRGTLPESLDLGCWGRYACRRYVPEPIRCFRCQAFGHHQRFCPRKDDLCGACSGKHPTRECLLRRREGVDTSEPLCINCGAGHYAWYRRCPARLRRIPGAVLPPRASQRRWAAPAVSSLPAAPVERSGLRPAATVTEQESARPSVGGSQRGRRRRRRRRGRRVPDEHSLPPPPPPRPREDMAATEPRKEMTAVPRAKETVTVAPKRKEHKSATTQTEDLRCNQRTQTGRCYVYSEAGLADLLIQYEHLLAQEREAQRRRTPHEPALHCVRRHVRGGERVPHKLPMEEPLAPSVQFRHHYHETEWVAYGKEEAENQEEDDVSTEEEEEIDPAAIKDDRTPPTSRWVRIMPKGIKPVPCSPANNSRGPSNRPSCKRDSS